MADFCVDCWNKIHGLKTPACGYVLSREEELCEECGEMKRMVEGRRCGAEAMAAWLFSLSGSIIKNFQKNRKK